MVQISKESITDLSGKSPTSTIIVREIFKKIWKSVYLIFLAIFNILE